MLVKRNIAGNLKSVVRIFYISKMYEDIAGRKYLG
jgi:hypothetical protein